MDIHRLVQEACETAKHWHLPLLVGFVSFIKIVPDVSQEAEVSELGEVPGDNILPNDILTSLSSRRGP